MKKTLSILALVISFLIPSLVHAKDVTFTTQLDQYSGKAAYIAIYLTNADGKYEQTIWLFGTKKRYYRALRGWAKGSGLNRAEYDGKTGATIPSAGTNVITVDLDDSLIDAGYQVHIDVVAEGNRPSRDDVVIELKTQNIGESVKGSTYIQSFEFKF